MKEKGGPQQATFTRIGRNPKLWKNKEYGWKIILPHPTFPMKYISWNVRGLHIPSNKICLSTLIYEQKTSIMIIHDTEFSSTTMENMVVKWWISCNVIDIDV